MGYIKTSSGVNWHYNIEGEGACLLFFHGWGVDKRVWKQQEKHFSQRYKVLTIDLPGHGKSTFEKMDLGALAEEIVEILDELKIDKCSIIGSSLGGLFALKIYEKQPLRVERLIFVGSMPKFVADEHYPFGLEVSKFKKLDGQLHSAYPSIVEIFFRSLFTRQDRATRRFKWLQKFRVKEEVPLKPALIEYLEVLEHEDLRDVLKKVAVPMQFINGRGDTICTPNTVKYIQKLAPQARYDWFEESGHFPFLIWPYKFNEMMDEFLNETNQ